MELLEESQGAFTRRSRGGSDDGQSIIGFSPKVTNLYLVATHSGVTLAPVISESAAIEIMDDVEIQALSPFRPSRFR